MRGHAYGGVGAPFVCLQQCLRCGFFFSDSCYSAFCAEEWRQREMWFHHFVVLVEWPLFLGSGFGIPSGCLLGFRFSVPPSFPHPSLEPPAEPRYAHCRRLHTSVSCRFHRQKWLLTPTSRGSIYCFSCCHSKPPFISAVSCELLHIFLLPNTCYGHTSLFHITWSETADTHTHTQKKSKKKKRAATRAWKAGEPRYQSILWSCDEAQRTASRACSAFR